MNDETLARVVAELLDLCDVLDNEQIDYGQVAPRIRSVLELEGLL